MPLSHVLSDRSLHVRRSLFFGYSWEKCFVYVLRRVPPRSANYDLVILLLPFEDGTGPHAESLSNLGRHGDLTLRGQL
jgi:hypothetical protein